MFVRQAHNIGGPSYLVVKDSALTNTLELVSTSDRDLSVNRLEHRALYTHKISPSCSQPVSPSGNRVSLDKECVAEDDLTLVAVRHPPL